MKLTHEELLAKGFELGPDGAYWRPPKRPVGERPGKDALGGKAPLRTAKRGGVARRGGRALIGVDIIVITARGMDDDNATGGVKWLRDAIARSLGVDDGDRRVRWRVYSLAGNPDGVLVRFSALQGKLDKGVGL